MDKQLSSYFENIQSKLQNALRKSLSTQHCLLKPKKWKLAVIMKSFLEIYLPTYEKPVTAHAMILCLHLILLFPLKLCIVINFGHFAVFAGVSYIFYVIL